MNRLKTDLYGGYPFELDDLRWMEEGIIAVLEAMLRAYELNPDSGYILTGMNYTHLGGEIYDVTEGWMLIGGELCYFPAAAGINAGVGSPHYYKNVSLAFDGNETFEDASVQDTYYRNTARFSTSALPATHTLFECERFGDVVLRLAETPNIPAWTYIDPGDTENSWASDPTHIVRWRKMSHFIELHGKVLGTLATADQMFGLPFGYRPDEVITVKVISEIDPTKVATITIEPTGEVNCSSFGNAWDVYYLDNIGVYAV